VAHENLVCNPLLPIVGEVVVLLGVLGEATRDVVAQGIWIRLRNYGREGHLFVGCPSFSHSAQEGLTRGGSGVVGLFFFCPPLAVVVVLVSGNEDGAVGVSMGICIGIPSIWGGRDG
jgi:hypothetical protein